ncbi:MAG: hypothetical protein WC890_04635 [Candidatus Margulisiibacteriota bacterium]
MVSTIRPTASSTMAYPSSLLLGFERVKIDPKLRFVMPARYRRLIPQGLILVPMCLKTPVKGKEILIIALLTQKQFEDRYNALETPDLQEKLARGSFDVEMDGTGRVQISKEMNEIFNFKAGRYIVIAGVGTHLQIWDTADWANKPAITLTLGIS